VVGVKRIVVDLWGRAGVPDLEAPERFAELVLEPWRGGV
jgi:hypothetical protein